VGKRSNRGAIWTVALLLLAIAGVGTLEYKGYTNWVPEVTAQEPFDTSKTE
jgi:hypothetical protein